MQNKLTLLRWVVALACLANLLINGFYQAAAGRWGWAVFAWGLTALLVVLWISFRR
jgi:hypothetical protein